MVSLEDKDRKLISSFKFNIIIKNIDNNPTIGIILCTDKKDKMVKKSVLSGNNNLSASKYKLYIPSEEESIKEIDQEKENVEVNSD